MTGCRVRPVGTAPRSHERHHADSRHDGPMQHPHHHIRRPRQAHGSRRPLTSHCRPRLVAPAFGFQAKTVSVGKQRRGDPLVATEHHLPGSPPTTGVSGRAPTRRYGARRSSGLSAQGGHIRAHSIDAAASEPRFSAISGRSYSLPLAVEQREPGAEKCVLSNATIARSRRKCSRRARPDAREVGGSAGVIERAFSATERCDYGT